MSPATPRAAVALSRFRDAVRVSWADGSPLPREIYDLLAEPMRYTERRFLRGPELLRAQRLGQPPVQTRRVDLHAYDERGVLHAHAGFASRLIGDLNGCGWPVRYELRGRWAAPPRPDCFNPKWAALKDFRLRDRQDECLQAIVNTCQARLGGIIAASPGFGKTALFKMAALLFPRARIAVTVRGNDLVKRTVADLKSVLPAVGQVGAGQRTRERVTVYSADSLHYADSDIDLLLADECHLLGADKYQPLFRDHVPEAIRIGLSGNAHDRSDGRCEEFMEALFGPVVFEISVEEATRKKLVAPVRVRWNRVPACEPYGRGMPPDDETRRKRFGIWANDARNGLIAERARSYGDAEQVLILVDRAEHAIRLGHLLPEYTVAFGSTDAAKLAGYKKLGLVDEDFQPPNARQRDRLRSAFEAGDLKKVIATHIWKQGISPDALQVLFWASAGSNKIDATQGPMRAARIFDGKAYGILEDFTDDFDPKYDRQHLGRWRIYDGNGWEQVDAAGVPYRPAQPSTTYA